MRRIRSAVLAWLSKAKPSEGSHTWVVKSTFIYETATVPKQSVREQHDIAFHGDCHAVVVFPPACIRQFLSVDNTRGDGNPRVCADGVEQPVPAAPCTFAHDFFHGVGLCGSLSCVAGLHLVLVACVVPGVVVFFSLQRLWPAEAPRMGVLRFPFCQRRESDVSSHASGGSVHVLCFWSSVAYPFREKRYGLSSRPGFPILDLWSFLSCQWMERGLLA